MSAKDLFHNAVKQALQKDGWTITHDPFPLTVDDINMAVDLGAEKLIAAVKGTQKIAVEVKSFVGASNITEFHTALRQFLNYRIALEVKEPDRVLYLAVPSDTFKEFFVLPFIQTVIHRHQLRLVVYRPEQEVIVTWIN
ncbi:MAG: XisH family protein [Anaerolineae bacterium]|nr:XisH family protein [Anaerolineae bacterium]